MGLRNSSYKKSPLDYSKGLFGNQKSTESVPLSQVEYGLSLILTRCVVSNSFNTFVITIFG